MQQVHYYILLIDVLIIMVYLQEHFGQLRGLNVAWVGDGNNNVSKSFHTSLTPEIHDIKEQLPTSRKKIPWETKSCYSANDSS